MVDFVGTTILGKEIYAKHVTTKVILVAFLHFEPLLYLYPKHYDKMLSFS